MSSRANRRNPWDPNPALRHKEYTKATEPIGQFYRGDAEKADVVSRFIEDEDDQKNDSLSTPQHQRGNPRSRSARYGISPNDSTADVPQMTRSAALNRSRDQAAAHFHPASAKLSHVICELDNVHNTRIPLSHQITRIDQTPSTFLGNPQSNLASNPGTFTLVDQVPPSYSVADNHNHPDHPDHDHLDHPDHPQIHSLVPDAKYAITASRKTVSRLPRPSDMTSVMLIGFLCVFFVTAMVNLSGTFIHHYNQSTTAPWIDYNQYVLESYTIQQHGIGAINKMLHEGPGVLFGIRSALKATAKDMLHYPDLSNFINSESTQRVNRLMYKRQLAREANLRKLTPLQASFVDFDHTTMAPRSKFYETVLQDHSMCSLDALPNYIPPSPYADRAHSTTDTTAITALQQEHQQQQTTEEETESIFGQVWNWMSGIFDKNRIKSQYGWQTAHLSHIYNVLSHFVYSSLFASMILCTGFLFKDFLALAFIRTMDGVYRSRYFPRPQINTLTPSWILNLSNRFEVLPVVPQVLCRGLCSMMIFALMCGVTTLACGQPVVAFTSCMIASLLWFRFQADPARLYEAVLVAYPSAFSSTEHIIHKPVRPIGDLDDDVDDDNVDDDDESSSSDDSVPMTRSATRRLRQQERRGRSAALRTAQEKQSTQIHRQEGKLNLYATNPQTHSFNYPSKFALALITFRHIVITIACCALLFTCFSAYREAFTEFENNPVIKKMSPIQYSDSLVQRFNPKVIGSNFFTWGRELVRSALSSSPFSTTEASRLNFYSTVRERTQQFISTVAQSSKHVFKLGWGFVSNLARLAQFSIIVLLIPRMVLAGTRFDISPTDYPAHILHMCYMALCVYFSIRMFFTMKNNNYISTHFLSPFSSRHRPTTHSQRGRNESDQEWLRKTRLSAELQQLSLDDSAITNFLQTWAVISLAVANYFTGGVVISLAFSAVDECIAMYRDIIRFRQRDIYAQRTSTHL